MGAYELATNRHRELVDDLLADTAANNGLAPPTEKLTGKSKERFVRDTVDSWINERVLSVKNLGSLIEIQLMIKRQVPVVRYKLLDIKRTSRVVVEPYFNEEWTREDPPNSLFDLMHISNATRSQ